MDHASGPYEKRPAVCQDYQPRAAEVAQRIAKLIHSRLPDVVVEHVGSTSLLACPGKGVVDLMLVYPERATASGQGRPGGARLPAAYQS